MAKNAMHGTIEAKEEKLLRFVKPLDALHATGSPPRRLVPRHGAALMRAAAVIVGLVLFSLTLPTHRAVADCTPSYPSSPILKDGERWVCDWPSGCFRCQRHAINVVAESCQATGSVIDIQNRIYQDTVNISGTPFRLHYHSDRVPGRTGVAEGMNSVTGQKLLSTAAMGGWTLDVFHIYDPSTGFLYPGDGIRRDVMSEGGPHERKSELLIASRNGTEVYVFDTTGRHLRTVNALTSAVEHHFNYDAAGRLTEVSDRAGNVTRLERGTAGELRAIVAPFGQRTTFTRDSNGYLATIANPAGETTQLHYTAQGLLDEFEDPRGYVKWPRVQRRGRTDRRAGHRRQWRYHKPSDNDHGVRRHLPGRAEARHDLPY